MNRAQTRALVSTITDFQNDCGEIATCRLVKLAADTFLVTLKNDVHTETYYIAADGDVQFVDGTQSQSAAHAIQWGENT